MTTPLERHRAKAGTTGAAADKARAAVADLDSQLATLTSLAEQQRQALRRAADETARLKRSLKAASKRQERLVKERVKAVARAEKAGARQATAESKYDRALLADMVRREKERDRAAPPISPVGDVPPPAAPAARKVTGRAAATTRAPRKTAAAAAPPRNAAAAAPPPEVEKPTITTARRTAARKTGS